ncbi:MAG: response regulator [Candidatus Thermoplasmatota archaeon]
MPVFEILLVDDSKTDVRIMEEALAGNQSRVVSRLHHARNGKESLAFLRKEGQFTAAPRPDLILLDVNMPGKSGLDVLAEIKGDPALRGIPTVMLTSSREERDVARAYDLQANGYVQKPVDFDDFMAVMGGIELFWTGVSRLPPRGAAPPAMTAP